MDVYEHIDDYIKGRLTSADKLAFESALSHDKELQSLVDNYQEISNVSEGLLELELLGEIKEVGQTVSFGDKWKIWKILVPILLLSAIAYFAFQAGRNAKQLEKQKVYFAANYERPDNPDTVRSADLNTLDDLGKAIYYFELNDFDAAEKVLKDIIQSSTDESELSDAHYWLGHVYLNKMEWEKAKTQFLLSKRNESKRYINFINRVDY